MSSYVESHLGSDERIVRKGAISIVSIVPHLFLMLVLVGFVTIWKPLIAKFTTEIAITDKRIVGKVGLLKTKSLDAPLNKVNNVSVSNGLMGKLFNYGTIRIDTSSGVYEFDCIKDAEGFKSQLLSQIDQFDADRIQKQAQAMASAIKQ